jgi:dUTP pyrophosphatase
MLEMPSYTLELCASNPEVAAMYRNEDRVNTNAGFDLFVPLDVSFAPNEKKLVSMQVKARMLDNNQHIPYMEDTNPTVHYWMPPRSSISKTGLLLLNSIGVIDRSYRGELMAFLWNTTSSTVEVKKGDRLVQIVAPDMGHISKVRLVNSLDETVRGSGGFGSSGR